MSECIISKIKSMIYVVLLLSLSILGCDDQSTSHDGGVSSAGVLAGQSSVEAGQSSIQAGHSGSGGGEGATKPEGGDEGGRDTQAGIQAGTHMGGASIELGGIMEGGSNPPVHSEDLPLDGLDPELFTRFDRAIPATDSSQCASLQFLYPELGTVIPRNLFGMTLQWGGEAFDSYLITARAGTYQARWLTTQSKLTPEGATWELLKSNRMGGVVEWTLSVLVNESRCDGGQTSIEIDPSELLGAVYYWSTGDMGIMRLAAGDREPEPLLTPSVSPELNCPACHALSRDGQRIAFTRTVFPPFGDLSVSEIMQPRSLLYDPSGVEGYFPSFSPNAGYLVAGSSGRVVMRDSNTGQELNYLSLPENTVGGIPDWSWQGDRITAVVGPSGFVNFLPNEGINSGSIYEWVKRTGESGAPGTIPEDWGTAVLLVPQEGDLSNDRPAYDPTGRMIAFNKEGSDPTAGEGMSNRNVSLWMIPVAQEGASPVELQAANQGEMKGNSWPKWAPTDQRGRLWLAFSSFRDYGHLLPNNSNTTRRPQIWVTAIDPNAPAGVDPSAPAFWLPFQDINSGNHIPYWAAYEKR